ncbi:MAG: hypothetical protein GC131_09040 [Alphaproteobacteria bacterium]|nr:hypothetical protein [Alphaproteobacteria bacterium]
MKWVADIKRSGKIARCEIERQLLTSLTSNVSDQFGYYLYVWENEGDAHDYLQDTPEIAMAQAFENFGVPLDAWKKVE